MALSVNAHVDAATISPGCAAPSCPGSQRADASPTDFKLRPGFGQPVDDTALRRRRDATLDDARLLKFCQSGREHIRRDAPARSRADSLRPSAQSLRPSPDTTSLLICEQRRAGAAAWAALLRREFAGTGPAAGVDERRHCPGGCHDLLCRAAENRRTLQPTVRELTRRRTAAVWVRAPG
jgi:hypothetical protein